MSFKELTNKPSSVLSSDYILNSKCDLFYSMEIKKIKSATLIEWQNQLLKSSYSNKYIGKIQTVVFDCFSFAIDHNYLSINPCVKLTTVIKHEVPKTKEYRILTVNEFNSFMSVINNLEHQAFFELLFWSGARISEILALQIQDFQTDKIIINKNWDSKNLILTTTKTGLSRLVVLPDVVINKLNELLVIYREKNIDKQAPLFSPDKRYPYTSIKRIKNDYCTQANIQPFTFHDLRHSHVSLLIHLGFSAFEISKRLGHSVEMVNETYGHLFPNVQQNIISKLNNEYRLSTKK